MRGMREVKGAKCVKRPNVIQDSNVEKQVFQTLHRRFTPVKQVWRPKQSRSHSFKFSKSVMLLMHYKNDSAFIISNVGRFSFITKTKPQKEPMWFNLRGKSSSSLDFKTPRETPGFSNNFFNGKGVFSNNFSKENEC